MAWKDPLLIAKACGIKAIGCSRFPSLEGLEGVARALNSQVRFLQAGQPPPDPRDPWLPALFISARMCPPGPGDGLWALEDQDCNGHGTWNATSNSCNCAKGYDLVRGSCYSRCSECLFGTCYWDVDATTDFFCVECAGAYKQDPETEKCYRKYRYGDCYILRGQLSCIACGADFELEDSVCRTDLFQGHCTYSLHPETAEHCSHCFHGFVLGSGDSCSCAGILTGAGCRSLGVLVGVPIGVVAVLGLAVGIGVLLYCRLRRRRSAEHRGMVPHTAAYDEMQTAKAAEAIEAAGDEASAGGHSRGARGASPSRRASGRLRGSSRSPRHVSRAEAARSAQAAGSQPDRDARDGVPLEHGEPTTSEISEVTLERSACGAGLEPCPGVAARSGGPRSVELAIDPSDGVSDHLSDRGSDASAGVDAAPPPPRNPFALDSAGIMSVAALKARREAARAQTRGENTPGSTDSGSDDTDVSHALRNIYESI